MIEATQMLQRMGKKAFVKYATGSQKGKTVKQMREKVNWGRGTVLMEICEHGKMTIRGGKPTKECKACNSATRVTKLKDFEPHFNMGLGAYVETKREFNNRAKEKGLTWIGDDGV